MQSPPNLSHALCAPAQMPSNPQALHVSSSSLSSAAILLQARSGQGVHLSHSTMASRPLVPTNEMLRERTLQLLAERRTSFNCSPPISPASSAGSCSPAHDAYSVCTDNTICTVGEPSSYGGPTTTTYLRPGGNITLSQQTIAQSQTALPVMRSSSLSSSASSEGFQQSFYGYQPPTPPSPDSLNMHILDALDEMIADPSSPFSELNEQLETYLEAEETALPLSHPPPLMCKQPTSWQHGDVSSANMMAMARNGQVSVDPSSFMPSLYQTKEDGRSGKAEVFPVVALWEFLLEALYYPCYEHILRWKNRQEGHFKIVDSQSLAKLWGLYKRKRDMNFDKMSRAMRYYYDKGILEKGGSGARLEYKFGPRSNWLEFSPPPGSKVGRFFNPQPPRRGRNRQSQSAANIPALTPMTGLPSPQTLGHNKPFMQVNSASTFGPQRSFQNYAGTRHSPY